MILAILGLLKQPFPPPDPAFEAALNEHLAQPRLRIINAGYLRGEQGDRIGLLALIEAETFAKARAFLKASPFQRHDYYERTEIAEFNVEVGRLG